MFDFTNEIAVAFEQRMNINFKGQNFNTYEATFLMSAHFNKNSQLEYKLDCSKFKIVSQHI